MKRYYCCITAKGFVLFCFNQILHHKEKQQREYKKIKERDKARLEELQEKQAIQRAHDMER